MSCEKQYEHVSLEIKDNIAHIILKRNSMHLPYVQELQDIAFRLDADDSVRVIVFSSANKIFCGGGDLAYFIQSGGSLATALKELTMYLHQAISIFHRMNAPTIAIVNGAAAGAGLSFAAQCDFIVASDKASFMSSYTGIGLSPDGSSSYFLPRLIGERRAKEMMITNRKINAEEALDWGLVNQVVPAGTELEAGMALARQLATGATAAFGTVKRLIQASSTSTLETQLAMEQELIAANSIGSDCQEGISAFLEKRAPSFTGKR